MVPQDYPNLSTFHLNKDIVGYYFTNREPEIPITAFGPINRVNLFIGANNSGKSRFLRAIANNPEQVFINNLLNGDKIGRIIQFLQQKGSKFPSIKFRFPDPTRLRPINYDYRDKLAQLFGKRSVYPIELEINSQWFNEIESMLESWFRKGETASEEMSSYHKQLSLIKDTTHPEGVFSKLGFNFGEGIEQSILDELYSLSADTDVLQNFPFITTKAKRVYIPVHRFAVSLRDPSRAVIHDDILHRMFQINYDLGANDSFEIFTANNLYSEVRHTLLSSREDRNKFEDFENFLSTVFFQNHPVDFRPHDKKGQPHDQHLYLYVEGYGERPLHDIGDGVQSVIILMFKLFTATEGSWIFIEEPELSLHPGLQRLLLETILQNPRIREQKLVLFMTTHSNHLLNLSIPEFKEVSIFSFQRAQTENRFTIQALHHRDNHPLDLLGVQNASVFLANCSIWVEGPTDRAYFREYLRAYVASEEFKKSNRPRLSEDIHYTFVEYAGSNLKHWCFDPLHIELEESENQRIRAFLLSGRIFLIADLDVGKEDKHKLLRQLSDQSTSLQYRATLGVEVENMIPELLLREVFSNLKAFKSMDVYQLSIKESDYREKRMGTYVNKLVPKEKEVSFAEKSGTLTDYYKGRFAELVKDKCTWEMMNDDLKQFIRDLYSFLLRHNGFSEIP